MATYRANNKPSEVAQENNPEHHLHSRLRATTLDDSARGDPGLRRSKTEKLSSKTVNNHLTVLRRMLVVAKKRGLIEAVPEMSG